MNSTLLISKFRDAKSLTGIQARVAQKLGLSANHVHAVAVGDRKSARVMKALIAEARKRGVGGDKVAA